MQEIPFIEYSVGDMVQYRTTSTEDCLAGYELPGIIVEKQPEDVGVYKGTPGYEFRYKILWTDYDGAWVGGWKWNYQLIPYGLPDV